MGADNGSAGAWSLHKLRAAERYIDLLSTIGELHGFSRLAGIEMALDGAVISLSGAFAAVAGVIVASEEASRPD